MLYSSQLVLCVLCVVILFSVVEGPSRLAKGKPWSGTYVRPQQPPGAVDGLFPRGKPHGQNERFHGWMAVQVKTRATQSEPPAIFPSRAGTRDTLACVFCTILLLLPFNMSNVFSKQKTKQTGPRACHNRQRRFGVPFEPKLRSRSRSRSRSWTI
jgi:hypothetical protein